MVSTARRVFTMEDQESFADLSGDYNPMHIDAIVARRTQAGAPVVHGIHLLFWALETLARQFDDLSKVTALRADFDSFLVIGREARWTAETSGEQTRVTLWADAVRIMTVQLHRDSRKSPAESVSYPSGQVYSPSQEAPLDMFFSQMQEMRGKTPFFRPVADYSEMFPNLARWIGATRVAALACATRIVGMVCPGLHSIFNRIEASFIETDDQADLQFAVTQADERFSRVGISAKGGGIAAVLTTTVRPSPVEQPAMSEIAQCVEERAFAGANALVVGGSRGLGELTAKYLAAGNARVTITYSAGRFDAERVAAEIKAFGRSCDVVAFDARRPANAQLGDRASTFTHVYYFATPKIVAQNVKPFDHNSFELFFDFYVSSFIDLCECLNSQTEDKVHVLYPSSIWVQKEERPSGWTEYAMAKAAGEIVCEDLSRRMKHIHVTSVRLPRLPTDQTASIVRLEQKASSLEVMGKIISAFQIASQR